MVNIVNNPVDLMKNRLARRGYNMEESKELLKNRKGNLMYVKKRAFRKSNVKDLKRFC